MGKDGPSQFDSGIWQRGDALSADNFNRRAKHFQAPLSLNTGTGTTGTGTSDVSICNPCDCCPEGTTAASYTITPSRVTCCPRAVGTFVLSPVSGMPGVYSTAADEISCGEEDSPEVT